MGRWIGFFIAIGAGIVLGLIYGWVVNPVQYVDTTPDTLREDYRTDYVLMVSESYQSDGNLALAVRRLALLGDDRPVEMVRRAARFANQVGYAQTDIALMADLERALQTWNPAVEGRTP